MHSRPHGMVRGAVGHLFTVTALPVLVAATPLRAQQPVGRDSAQFAQMQGMMGPMMEQMMTAGMTATLRVLAKPESAQQLATFVRNFYDALVAKGFANDEALKIVMAFGMPHPAGGR